MGNGLDPAQVGQGKIEEEDRGLSVCDALLQRRSVCYLNDGKSFLK
jgi:hypothetical protein